MQRGPVRVGKLLHGFCRLDAERNPDESRIGGLLTCSGEDGDEVEPSGHIHWQKQTPTSRTKHDEAGAQT